jgi:DNA invertase Pin-like site-specific DNA recombinase
MLRSRTIPHQLAGKRLRAARVTRVSTEEQFRDGKAGIQRQIDQTNRVIEARNYELVAELQLIGVSGASVAHSSEFRQLISLIETGKIDVVVVSEMSRLMRVDSWESLAVLDTFARHHVLVVADGTEIDYSNPEGFLSGGIQTLLAGHERMKLVQKITAAKTALKRQGKLASGRVTLPYAVNYDRGASKFFYDQAEIWRVQEAYRLIDEEGIYNLAEVARRVGFKRTGLRVVLQNPIYGHGVRRYDKKANPDVKRVGANGRKTYRPKIQCDPEEVIEVKVIDEPAVSRERWERVQKVLTELRTNHLDRLPKEKLVHLCSALGKCGYCGQKLYLAGNGKRDKQTGERLLWYCCRSQHPGRKQGARCANSWIAKKKLDGLLVSFAQQVMTDVDFLTRIISASVRMSQEVVTPFPSRGAGDAIAKLRKKEKRLLAMCKEGVIGVAECKRDQVAIRAEIERLEALQAPAQTEGPQSVQELARLIVKGAMRFKNIKSTHEQRAVLESLFAEVFFRDESISDFRLHQHVVSCMGDGGGEFAQTIHLETAYRLTPPPIPDRASCSKCGLVQHRSKFPKGRRLCPSCYRTFNRERSRRYRAKCHESDGPTEA